MSSIRCVWAPSSRLRQDWSCQLLLLGLLLLWLLLLLATVTAVDDASAATTHSKHAGLKKSFFLGSAFAFAAAAAAIHNWIMLRSTDSVRLAGKGNFPCRQTKKKLPLLVLKVAHFEMVVYSTKCLSGKVISTNFSPASPLAKRQWGRYERDLDGAVSHSCCSAAAAAATAAAAAATALLAAGKRTTYMTAKNIAAVN
jgi:hypothetical protein